MAANVEIQVTITAALEAEKAKAERMHPEVRQDIGAALSMVNDMLADFGTDKLDLATLDKPLSVISAILAGVLGGHE